ncbi:MAG: Flp pilus assembly protein CpaB [Planctomycetota bacterium]
MRAYTIHLRTGVPDRALLYPGCFVDVLFTAKLSGRDPRGEAIATPLLEEIQLLAIGGESVITHGNGEESKSSQRTSSRGLAVTLLVDSRQAAALQLAAENGIISLAMRNPLDKKKGDREPMVLSQGQLADLASVLMLEDLAKEPEEVPAAVPPVSAEPIPPATPNETRKSPKRRAVTVIRGNNSEVEELTIPKDDEPGNNSNQ